MSMLHKKYEEEKKYNELIARKNVKNHFYNGIYNVMNIRYSPENIFRLPGVMT